MKSSNLTIFIFLFSVISSFSQTDMIVLKSNIKKLDIRDNNVLKENEWTIMPELSVDRYITRSKNSYVTFYSDIDSVSFYIEPNKKIQFFVILNVKDTALTEIVYMKPYIEILKSASKYDISKKNNKIKFKYQSKNNRHLKFLRKKYNLDTIAGTGDEILQLLRLMKWLHDKVPHRGSEDNPKIKNTDNMLSVCKTEERGLNCRGLAIVFNECCLSLGFKSRYVTCSSKDSLSIDDDCHVINMVYINKLEKWIWLDPTFNAYVMNKKGEILSIEEVREYLINDKPLKINKDANWNNKNKVDISEYLYEYMAKNLYTFKCPTKSKYNMETHIFWKLITNKLNFVQLIPMDYKKDVSNFYNKIVTNPDIFWQKPK